MSEESTALTRVLITGGAGFIGSHVIEHLIRTTTWEIVCVDKLSYSSKGWARVKDSGVFYMPRLHCLTWDLTTPFSEGLRQEIGDINIIIHMAAETHVDKSIADPVGCIQNNVMSTVYLLEYARTLSNLRVFQYFSTDEVYGPAPNGTNYKEWDRHRPTNPYSASKAASEDICLSYENTYKIPVIITNLMNVYGERQYVEKFIPLVMKKILKGETVSIHTEPDGKTPGSRFYIHARNVAAAVLFILSHGTPGEKYNITGEKEVDNLEMAQKIALAMDKELKYQLVDFHSDRPGHDTRYSLDGSKLFQMGWHLPVNLDASLAKTVHWTLQHPQWLDE
jgi:dTDP-glucose 4,6-dehydratase